MTIVEIGAIVFTIASVIMLARASYLGWIFSVLGCLLYAYIFFEQKLYANVILQVVFILQSAYACKNWFKDNKEKEEFISIKLDWMSLVVIFVLACALSIMIGSILSMLFAAHYPFVDTSLSVCSIFATIMLMRKLIQTWFLWMLIDIGYVFLFLNLGLWLSAILYFVLFLICTKGYVDWSKKKIIPGTI